jgi:hypothetical protein
MSRARTRTAALAIIAVVLLAAGCGAADKVQKASESIDKANKTIDACNDLNKSINTAIDNLNAANKAAKSEDDPAYQKKVTAEMATLHTALTGASAKPINPVVITATKGMDTQVIAWGAKPGTYAVSGAANKFNDLAGAVEKACNGK